nr:oxidoreductase [Mycolicibacter nonchromogenicus]
MQPELNALSKQGQWAQMGARITDEILHTIVACGTPAQVAAHIRDRVEGIADTVCVYQAAPIAPAVVGQIVSELS